ncbi:MAG TPA: hypothetical protein VFM88_11930 [Vicinamibacteria bacterium]|nr:hypothetical protein [Vicinamibacteria bacterium]
MRSPSKTRARLLTAVLALALPGCGGGGGGGSSSPTAPSTPTRRAIGNVNFQVLGTNEARRLGLIVDAFLQEISITGTAANPLEMIADWTFASNDIDIVLFRGSCTPQAFIAQSCTELAATTSTTTKPERLVVSNVAPGGYTIAIVNFGPTNESGVLQVFATQ